MMNGPPVSNQVDIGTVRNELYTSLAQESKGNFIYSPLHFTKSLAALRTLTKEMPELALINCKSLGNGEADHFLDIESEAYKSISSTPQKFCIALYRSFLFLKDTHYKFDGQEDSLYDKFGIEAKGISFLEQSKTIKEINREVAHATNAHFLKLIREDSKISSRLNKLKALVVDTLYFKGTFKAVFTVPIQNSMPQLIGFHTTNETLKEEKGHYHGQFEQNHSGHSHDDSQMNAEVVCREHKSCKVIQVPFMFAKDMFKTVSTPSLVAVEIPYLVDSEREDAYSFSLIVIKLTAHNEQFEKAKILKNQCIFRDVLELMDRTEPTELTIVLPKFRVKHIQVFQERLNKVMKGKVLPDADQHEVEIVQKTELDIEEERFTCVTSQWTPDTIVFRVDKQFALALVTRLTAEKIDQPTRSNYVLLKGVIKDPRCGLDTCDYDD